MPSSFVVTWNKGDAREQVFYEALAMAKVVRVELVRSLMDEWAKRVIAANAEHIEAAASAVSSGKKKK